MDTTTVRRLTLVEFVLGLWILAAPTATDAPPPAAWSGLLTGGVVVSLAIYDYVLTSGDAVPHPWAPGTMAVAGALAAATAVLLGPVGAVTWSVTLAGVVVAGAAAYSGYWADAGRPEHGTRV
ncbi:SPW repeat domain-containing protein [Halarchaeum sp. P4]|uniref:SPW repeat domain-containing protein n=1 Tax=Halarchaeum sp. P4 TaxID=3421639 RepID=UPI003EB7D12A